MIFAAFVCFSLFWSDRDRGTILSCDLETRHKRLLVSLHPSAQLYGVTVFQVRIIWDLKTIFFWGGILFLHRLVHRGYIKN